MKYVLVIISFMKLIKISIIFLTLPFFYGCIHSTALLAPGITVVTTGNVLHAGLQYGANTAIKNETGKDTLEHLKTAVNNQNKDKKFKLKFKEMVEKRFEITRQKLSTN